MKTKTTIYVGKTATLQITGTTKTVTWTSLNNPHITLTAKCWRRGSDPLIISE